MSRFIARRALQAVPTLFGITLLSFVLLRLAPGDPVSVLIADMGALSSADLAAARSAYGLNQPIPIQYLRWLAHLASGDFGHSFQSGRPVLELIGTTLLNTLELTVPSLLVAVAGGVLLGAFTAVSRGSWLDHTVRLFSVAGHAVPSFWVGLLFIVGASLQLHWFPVGGMLTIGASQWDVFDRLRHLVGPVLVLSLGGLANFSRLVRANVLDVMTQDFVRTARAKGMSARTVLLRHTLRNAILPVITAMSNLLASVASGSLVVEVVFGWPGMGRLLYDAARAKDEPVVMGTVVISSVVLVVSYLLRDVAYGIADPRIHHA